MRYYNLIEDSNIRRYETDFGYTIDVLINPQPKHTGVRYDPCLRLVDDKLMDKNHVIRKRHYQSQHKDPFLEQYDKDLEKLKKRYRFLR